MRVLIAEDDPDIASGLCASLRRQGTWSTTSTTVRTPMQHWARPSTHCWCWTWGCRNWMAATCCNDCASAAMAWRCWW